MSTQIVQNLASLRKMKNISQEELANRVGVSRQAVAKWERGATTPDMENGLLLADYFGVSLDTLVNYESPSIDAPLPPKGKHLFGIATLGERGQIVLPKEARDLFDLKTGDKLLVLGDESQGIALTKADAFVHFYDAMQAAVKQEGTNEEE